MEPPLIAVDPGASVITERSALPPPPTAPPKLVVPAVFTVRLRAVVGDCSVLANAMLPAAPAPLLVRVVFAPSATGSLYVCVVVVTIAPPLIAVDPGASVVTDKRALPAPAPTVPLNVVAP